MGDLAEIRGLLTVVAFLGVLSLILSWMPSELYSAGAFREVYTPEEFEAIEVYSFADYEAIVMDESSGHVDIFDSTIWVYEDFVIGNWDCDFGYRRANLSNLICTTKHEAWEFIVLPDFHHLPAHDTSGVDVTVDGWLTIEAIEANAEPNGYVSRFRLACQHFTLYQFFSFNITERASFTEAWNHEEMRVFWGINFDDVDTSYNAFQLVSMLLWFSFPTMPFYIQAPMSIVLWVCIAYTLYVLILKMIPFLSA